MLAEIIAALFVLLFIYTSISKLMSVQSFALAMSHSPLIGSFSRPLSLIVPGLEVIVAIALIIPQSRYIGLIASALLMTIFTFYIAYIILFASKLPCTCGGVIENMTWSQHLAFNVLFLSLGIVAIIIYKKQNRLIAKSRSRRIPV